MTFSMSRNLQEPPVDRMTWLLCFLFSPYFLMNRWPRITSGFEPPKALQHFPLSLVIIGLVCPATALGTTRRRWTALGRPFPNEATDGLRALGVGSLGGLVTLSRGPFHMFLGQSRLPGAAAGIITLAPLAAYTPQSFRRCSDEVCLQLEELGFPLRNRKTFTSFFESR